MLNATRWGARAALAAFLTAGPALAPAGAQTAPAVAAKPAADPAALVVQDFYDALFDAMRHAGEWHMQGRYDRLYPVMVKLFDVPAMTRIAVGPDFAKLTPDQQSALRDSFGKLLAATFASTFDDFKGETYAVDGDVAMRGTDKFVKSRFNGEGAPVDINFLLRGRGTDWHVVDIYLNGTISQLATWHSEYGSTFQDAGFDGLMAAVKSQTDKDMKAF
ncbi:hopanoid biosynthesis protein HpnM [Lichenibacterium minor]|uniref:Hopanoid biosynthesis protein HpnM n=1 Tax=Lichenibacterium minor TaxID=2316528 RepID=A0A4Q2U8I4_9HYPH|nr:ABC transporter substrate-binding protein [Lichenibacterium minor]RYC32742.1 hopanoid biosynthesis protein HpnM [Lichenibacterium minor]